MIKHNQDGAVSGLAISFVMTILVLIGSVAFGAWAYTSRQDYKNNSDQKAAAAAAKAATAESAKKDRQFAEDAKFPFRIYNGPDAYGSLHLEYPKTWSGYIDASGSGEALVNGYFMPAEVPAVNDQKSLFALRVQVVNQPYTQVIQQFSGQQQAGKLAVSAYALPKLPKVVGVMAKGQLSDQKNVTMVVLPLRSETVKIWTEGDQFTNDFNNNILPNFTFSP